MTTATKKSTARKTTAKKVPVKKSVMKKAAPKTAAKSTPKTAPKKSVKKTTGESKMSIAVKVVEEMFQQYSDGEIKRKDVLERMMKEANLTKAGASTYFANIKAKILNDEM